MTNDNAYQRLRMHAERIVRQEPVALTEEERFDLLRLTHELELARTELEAQNEELRSAVRDLEAARNAYFDLYESAPVAYVALGKKGVVERANALARDLLGHAETPCIGRGFSQFVPPDDQGRYFRVMRKVAATNQAQAFELRLAGPRDRHFQAHLQVVPKFDAERRFRYWHLAFFDITDLRRRETELEAIHAQLALAARAAGLGTWTCDLEKRAALWDRGLYRLLRLKPREGPEDVQRLFAFIHPDDRTGAMRNLESLLDQEGDEIREEFRVVRSDGQVRWMAARGTIFRNMHGRPRRVAGISYDITARKQDEEAARLARIQLARQLAETERANEELSQYAYAVSHDLKAPLRAMRNYAEFLYEDLADTLSGEQKAYLEGLKQAVGQGDELINDLLNLSRLDQMPLERDAADVPEIVSEIQALLGSSEDLEIIVAPRWPDLRADHMLLRQILHNLISNAVKFNRPPTKRITVGWQPAAGGGIEIFVRDNGIGISPRYAEQIFRIFQRLHTRQEYEGTGIGLAIVRKAAHKLGGTVRMASEPEKGSTFFIQLPGVIGEEGP